MAWTSQTFVGPMAALPAELEAVFTAQMPTRIDEIHAYSPNGGSATFAVHTPRGAETQTRSFSHEQVWDFDVIVSFILQPGDQLFARGDPQVRATVSGMVMG